MNQTHPKRESKSENKEQSPKISLLTPKQRTPSTTRIHAQILYRVSKSDDYFFFSFQSITAVTEKKQ